MGMGVPAVAEAQREEGPVHPANRSCAPQASVRLKIPRGVRDPGLFLLQLRQAVEREGDLQKLYTMPDAAGSLQRCFR